MRAVDLAFSAGAATAGVFLAGAGVAGGLESSRGEEARFRMDNERKKRKKENYLRLEGQRDFLRRLPPWREECNALVSLWRLGCKA